MDEPLFPNCCENLIQRLIQLQAQRRAIHIAHRNEHRRRLALSAKDRKIIAGKTASLCHICGGQVQGRWQADHVLAYSGGGRHSVENYLAAHSLCNNYRWDYLPEEFQWILKIGVWAKTEIRRSTPLGKQIASAFYEYEVRRQKRRKKKARAASA